MLIFSVSFQFLRMTPKGSTDIREFLLIYKETEKKITYGENFESSNLIFK